MGLINSSSQHFVDCYPVAQPFYDQPIGAPLEDSEHRRRRRVTLQLRKSHNPYLIGRANRSIPCTCSITGEGSRNNVDLVCLIDVSGSMMGAKLDILKETLHYILNLLNENDRLSLIAFNTQAYKLSHLVRVSARNKPALARIINQIQPQGETQIDKGLECALRTLAERKHRNSVSSIFLLSDGKDKTIANCIKLLKDGQYSVHTFGFGIDYNRAFLAKVASAKGGNVQYIILENIDEVLINTFGAIFSVVAETVKIRIKQVASGKFSSVRIQKTFGPMWKKGLFSRDYEINVEHLISDSTKDFVFMLEVPLSYEQLTNTEREQHILQAEIEVLTPSGEVLRGQTRMSMTFYGASQNPGVEVVPDTYVNTRHLRALTTEIIINEGYSGVFPFGWGFANTSSIMDRLDQLAPIQPATQPILESLKKASSQIQVGNRPVYQAVKKPLVLQNNIAYSNPQQIHLQRNLMIHKRRKNTPILK